MSSDRLAIEGGAPALPRPLGSTIGASLIGRAEAERVRAVVESASLFRYYGPDPQGTVAELERRLSERLGGAHTLAVSSGTAALRVACAAAGLAPGDEVILPAYAFLACATALLGCGLVPVIAECGADLLLDPERIEARITPRTRAILAVHMNGAACDTDAIGAIAGRRGLLLLEDAAQAFGARLRGREVGTLGAAACFSFQYMKTITSGEGGLVATADRALRQRAESFHDLGFHRPGRDGTPLVGENLRMGELAGAVALAQLDRVDPVLASCRATHRRWREAAEQHRGIEARRVPDADGDSGTSLVLGFADASTARFARKALRAENVPCDSCRDKVVHLYPVLAADPLPVPFWPPSIARPRFGPGLAPDTEARAARTNAIPVSPAATAAEVDLVARAIEKVGRRLAMGGPFPA